MISRRTIFSFLFALLLAAGLWVWSSQHRDECSAFLGGDRHAPASQVVRTGTRIVIVPCENWLVRQPVWVQMSCVLAVAGVGIFLVSAWSDWKKEGRRW